MPLVYITTKAIILTVSEHDKATKQKKVPTLPTFRVALLYDAKPPHGGEFFGKLDWKEQHSTGMFDGDWDPEPVFSKKAKLASPVKKSSPVKRTVNYRNKNDSDSSSDSDTASKRKRTRKSKGDGDGDEDDWKQPVKEGAYRRTKSSKNSRTIRLAIANAGNESQSDQGSQVSLLFQSLCSKLIQNLVRIE